MKDQTILRQKIFRKNLCLVWSCDFQLLEAVTMPITGCWLCHALGTRDPAVMTVWFTVQSASLTVMGRMKIFLKKHLLHMAG